MLVNIAASAALVGSIAAGSIPANSHVAQAPSGQNPLVHTIGYSEESGKERLRKLLRPHVGFVKITQAAKNATGDPNINVIDHRGLSGGVHTCSYLNPRGKRILICD